MPALLVSLGTSPAVVPEAFLLPGVVFSAVHVLTTASVRDEEVAFVEGWFAENAEAVALTVTRVSEFTDFQSEEDHFLFEEVLYRWYREQSGEEPPYVCLSGGFKTMSAAMQKAASVLGAREVFHVLADSVYPDPRDPAKRVPAATTEQIGDSLLRGNFHWIKLGSEGGWPQLRAIAGGDYPLHTDREEGRVRWVSVPNRDFRERLGEIVERSHNIAGAWAELGTLPFSILATWSAADLAWLQEPLCPESDRAWIAGLPKVELHCHLGGFATHGSLLEAVRAAALDTGMSGATHVPTPPEDWPLPSRSLPLKDYMALGDANGSALLGDVGCLRRQCELLYAHLRAQNIVHAEIRCSPGNYAQPGRSPWCVLSDIKSTFDRCMAEDPGCHVNLIIIATRKDKGDYRAGISRHLALAVSAAEHWTGGDECRVVGVDLAGFEDPTTRAHYFREEFTGVHRCGLAVTVHAGENDDAEGIWRAVFDLNARRLGHALHLIDSPELLGSVADRGIGVEMCPYANYQIKGFDPMPPDADGKHRACYPLKRYLDAGVRVTVNTDNIGISAADLTDNFLLAARLCPGLTRQDILRLLAHARDSAFLSPLARLDLGHQIEGGLFPGNARPASP